ncbi:unnamed protein product [Paramecium pentaurelia]|uniref:Uncharacterized protein n=1 Tax=Paramecium pentaurelia TaxID=43138 RepID=A0A8S1XDA9_9CILI|nr:unnamed protein product [Paramecium pentaurelia]
MESLFQIVFIRLTNVEKMNQIQEELFEKCIDKRQKEKMLNVPFTRDQKKYLIHI